MITLKRFEPNTFPIAISECPFFAADIDVDISGKEVPNAKIVTPIIDSFIPYNFDKFTAL